MAVERKKKKTCADIGVEKKKQNSWKRKKQTKWLKKEKKQNDCRKKETK